MALICGSEYALVLKVSLSKISESPLMLLSNSFSCQT